MGNVYDWPAKSSGDKLSDLGPDLWTLKASSHFVWLKWLKEETVSGRTYFKRIKEQATAVRKLEGSKKEKVRLRHGKQSSGGG